MAGKTPVITKIEPVVPLVKPRLRVEPMHVFRWKQTV